MPVDPDYAKWLAQHSLPDAQAVQVLEFQHPKWGSQFLTDYGAGFSGTTETAVAFTAQPVAMQLEKPSSGATTQQELSVKMDALGGYVIDQIRQMTDAERDIPIKLIWRVYLDTKPGAPALDPLDFLVLDVSATRVVVDLRCAANLLPNVAAGIRYTLDKFPTLAFL